jgi:Ni/Co efflux regulator RcnB
MKRIVLAVICTAFAASAMAAPKPCEELKDEIEAQIQAKNVTSYTLEIVSNEDVHDENMVVGTCENGTRKIIYQRNDK